MIWYDFGSIFGSIHYACPPEVGDGGFFCSNVHLRQGCAPGGAERFVGRARNKGRPQGWSADTPKCGQELKAVCFSTNKLWVLWFVACSLHTAAGWSFCVCSCAWTGAGDWGWNPGHVSLYGLQAELPGVAQGLSRQGGAQRLRLVQWPVVSVAEAWTSQGGSPVATRDLLMARLAWRNLAMRAAMKISYCFVCDVGWWGDRYNASKQCWCGWRWFHCHKRSWSRWVMKSADQKRVMRPTPFPPHEVVPEVPLSSGARLGET